MSPAERPLFNLPDPETVRHHGRVAAVRAGLEVPQPGPARTARRPLGASLRIAVLAPRTDVGGGARILFELSNRLHSRGHAVRVLSHAPAPLWFPLTAPFSQVPVGHSLAHALPVCDVVLAGYWELVPEVAALQAAPVVHVEQGDFHLFEDLAPPVEDLVRRTLARADAHTVVSSTVGRLLEDRYGVRAEVVPNAVDPSVFHPRRDARDAAAPEARRTVLAVGWDGNTFKGVDRIRLVAERLRSSHRDVDVVWVTPKAPLGSTSSFARVVVAPPQQELADLYRSASAYVCASDYESFALPVMEAMSCGTPVVSTRNPGSLEYCRDGLNSLLVHVDDADGLHTALARVLDEPELAARLVGGGSTTAASYTWDAVIDTAEVVYRRVAEAAAADVSPGGWTAARGLERSSTPPPGEDVLERVLQRSGASRVLVPVTRRRAGGLPVQRWEVAHQRSSGEGEVRVFAPHHARPGCGPVVEGADAVGGVLEALDGGGVAQALELAVSALERKGPGAGRAPLVVLAALCLVMCGSPLQALHLLVAAWQDDPDHADLYRLVGWAAAEAGIALDEARLTELVEATGTGARHDAWLVDADASTGHPSGSTHDAPVPMPLP